MQLVTVEIRDYRSIFVDDAGMPLRLSLGPGANTLVGQNNCGKSNILRAVALALDPNMPYDPEADRPGPRAFAHPIVTLGFRADPSHPGDGAVLEAAADFERAAGAGDGATRAARGEVVLQVSFVPTPDGVFRRETLLPLGSGPLTSNDEVRQALDAAIDRLRAAVGFVLISSGESLESVLEGNFREILHSVVRDRMRDAFENAERSRTSYVTGLQDSLLRPLRDRLVSDVGAMFPEIEAIGLVPDVSSIDRTLSNVEVSLEDIVSTPLSGKGTGVRGGVLVAMLSYLALNATRSMVFAVEEPEAFLHPAAQEDLRDRIEQLAGAEGVSLLVTTHSPFTVTRSPDGRIFNLAKDREGRTRLAQSAAGDAEHAPLIGDLLREATLERVLAASNALPPGTEAVLLVEGDGDRFCLELAARVVDRPDLLEGLHIRPTGGTFRMIADAVIVRAASNVPVVAVVDNDQPGRDARKQLTGHLFEFARKRVLTYAEVFGGGPWANFGVEAEDLFDTSLIEGFVEHHGQSVIDGMRKRPDGSFHYDLGQSAKVLLEEWLGAHARPPHVQRWIELLLLLRERAGLSVPAETAEAIVASAPEPGFRSDAVGAGHALIVSGQHDYARYVESAVLVLDADAPPPVDVTHVGFYARAIHPQIAAIVGQYPNLLFDEDTAARLRSTGRDEDVRVADVIAESLRTESLAGRDVRAHHVVLLSPADDERTLVLDGPIKNTKQIGGRPVAWTVSQQLVPVKALAASPSTTDELDALAKGDPDGGVQGSEA